MAPVLLNPVRFLCFHVWDIFEVVCVEVFLKLDYLKKTIGNVNVCNHIGDSVYYHSWEGFLFQGNAVSEKRFKLRIFYFFFRYIHKVIIQTQIYILFS